MITAEEKVSGKKLGYIRVSTTSQNSSRQLDGIQLDKVFTDMCSGKDMSRPQFQAMLDYAREGDEIFVHSMDRLARNLKDLLSIIDSLKKEKIAIKFLKENIYITGGGSSVEQLILHILGAAAEFERSMILDRQKEGIALAKKAGVYKGRKPSLTGDRLNQAKKMLNEGVRPCQIMRHLKISRSTFYRNFKAEELVSEDCEKEKKE
jgi:DNA invertase Pin-like site-specific DNA recombinase